MFKSSGVPGWTSLDTAQRLPCAAGPRRARRMPSAAARRAGITVHKAIGQVPDEPVGAPVFGNVVTSFADPLDFVDVGVGVFVALPSSIRWSQEQDVSVKAFSSIVTFPSSALPEKSVPSSSSGMGISSPGKVKQSTKIPSYPATVCRILHDRDFPRGRGEENESGLIGGAGLTGDREVDTRQSVGVTDIKRILRIEAALQRIDRDHGALRSLRHPVNKGHDGGSASRDIE